MPRRDPSTPTYVLFPNTNDLNKSESATSTLTWMAVKDHDQQTRSTAITENITAAIPTRWLAPSHIFFSQACRFHYEDEPHRTNNTDIDSAWGLSSAGRGGVEGEGVFPFKRVPPVVHPFMGAAAKQMLLSWPLCEGATFVKVVS
jgi:hypothetical protein